jgi:hypothetical protein
MQSFTALGNDLTVNADTGTPASGQKAIFRFYASAAQRTVTFTLGLTGNAFRNIGVTTPVIIPVGKTAYVGCIYNLNGSIGTWDIVAVSLET